MTAVLFQIDRLIVREDFYPAIDANLFTVWAVLTCGAENTVVLCSSREDAEAYIAAYQPHYTARVAA